MRLSRMLLRCVAGAAIFAAGALALGSAASLGAQEAQPEQVVTFRVLSTALHELAVATVPLVAFSATGGAVEPVADDLLVVTPDGLLLVVAADQGDPTRLDMRLLASAVPMGWENARANPILADPRLNRSWIRVADALVVPAAGQRVDLYVSHHVVEPGCIAIAVSALPLATAADITVAGDWRRVFTAAPCLGAKKRGHLFVGNQVGGRLAFGGDGRLRLALGDHGFDGVNDPWKAASDPATALGKVLAIDPATGDAEIVASGLRNPQGLLRLPDGRLFETEHGPRGGDELNAIVAGAHYGWPEVTLGLGYAKPWPPNPVQGRHDGYREPLFAFVPSIGVSNLALAPADFPLWDGDLLVGTLRDKAIHRLRFGEGRVLYDERIELGERLRDLAALPDGGLAALTDSAALLIIRRRHNAGAEPGRLHVRGRIAADQQARAVLEERGSNGAGLGAAVFAARCGGCHRLDGVNDVGPALNGVLDRAVGTAPGFAYSPALAAVGGKWSDLRLLDFLTDPAETFAGSTMPHVPLPPAHYWPMIEYLRDSTHSAGARSDPAGATHDRSDCRLTLYHGRCP